MGVKTTQIETLKLNEDPEQLLCSLKDHDLVIPMGLKPSNDIPSRVSLRASAAGLDMFKLTKAVTKLKWSSI